MFNKVYMRLTLYPVIAILFLASCRGDQGPEGDMGAQGPEGAMGDMGDMGDPGDPGERGDTGPACWDLDGNGNCEVADEDTDNNGLCDARDCRVLPVYTNPDTGQLYSLNASYCGISAAIDGNAGGYSGSKSMCETACNTATAHLCTAPEIVRFSATGGTMPAEEVWIGTGTASLSTDLTQRFTNCNGFTSNAGDMRSSTWLDNRPDSSLCTNSLPLACCD